MTEYTTRYKKLNPAQREAVDTIEGPLMVIAGPGTGKTELLSMRAATILKSTDTLPENILCLTFTESGAAAMRERLADIIGPDAYRVNISTFHGFGTEIINQHREYFYRGAEFKPADELSSYEILTSIFDELDYSNPLASKMGDDYTFLSDTFKTISELKRSGLNHEELLTIIAANEHVLDIAEPNLTSIFSARPSKTTASLLVPIAEKVAAEPAPSLPAGITPLGNTLSLSLAHAVDEASEANSTKPITTWRNTWMEKNEQGSFVFKDRKRHAKLRAVSSVYYAYLTRMEREKLFDFDDMILGVVHAMEQHADLKFNLQEKYQYIMVDEFQDTNLAQLRMLFNLTDNPVHEERPNVMCVGDDDQAIYSFQGADVNNIHLFRNRYREPVIVALTDNYRSTEDVISRARSVITQGEGRLETTLDISKELATHRTGASDVQIVELPSANDERQWIAENIAQKIAAGEPAETITVIARRHHELVNLLPYLSAHDILVNYERRDNVLDNPAVVAAEQIAHVLVELAKASHNNANDTMPALVSHPMFGFDPMDIWKLSLSASKERKTWLEVMITRDPFVDLATWLISLSGDVAHQPFEVILDRIIGLPTPDDEAYTSPLYEHYFSPEKLDKEPDAYLRCLNALRTIRSKLREYLPNEPMSLERFLEFTAMHRALGSTITSVTRRGEHIAGAINLMTAHKSKGLEFERVYIVNSTDSSWGETARTRGRLISYPANLQLAPAGSTYDERLRLFFVAMTRAKAHLTMSYALLDDRDKPQLAASFLTGVELEPTPITPDATVENLTHQSELAWHDHLTTRVTADMKQLLTPLLETYKLSSTHLNNFLDLSSGGPHTFLLMNLLRFPQAKPAAASYGTAIHATLQRAHDHVAATGNARPLEDTLHDFETKLKEEELSDEDYHTYYQRGVEALTAYITAKASTFRTSQKTELNFAGQGVVVGNARLTGKMDLVDIEDNSITVTDYKTGSATNSWKGKDEYGKIKLHKYNQQLMFYALLVKYSRDFAKYEFDHGVLQFVEPSRASGEIYALENSYSDEDLARFETLINAVWHCIATLEFPDTTQFSPTYKGILEFEQYLIDNYTN